MKKCSKCNEEKLLTEFHYKNKAKGKRRAVCRQCWSLYHHKHYTENKQRYVDQAAARKKKLKTYVNKIKSSSPCTDCEVSYNPRVMQFDHIGADKDMEVSILINYGSLERIKEEISKCELVCANCHMERTHRRRTRV